MALLREVFTVSRHMRFSTMEEWIEESERLIALFLRTSTYDQLPQDQQKDIYVTIQLLAYIVRLPAVAREVDWIKAEMQPFLEHAYRKLTPEDIAALNEKLKEVTELPNTFKALFPILDFYTVALISHIDYLFGDIDPKYMLLTFPSDNNSGAHALHYAAKYVRDIIEGLEDEKYLLGRDVAIHPFIKALQALLSDTLDESGKHLAEMLRIIALHFTKFVVYEYEVAVNKEDVIEQYINAYSIVFNQIKSFVEMRAQTATDAEQFEYFGKWYPAEELGNFMLGTFVSFTTSWCITMVSAPPDVYERELADHGKRVLEKSNANALLCLFKVNSFMNMAVSVSLKNHIHLPFSQFGSSHTILRTILLLGAQIMNQDKATLDDHQLNTIRQKIIHEIDTAFNHDLISPYIEWLNDGRIRAIEKEQVASSHRQIDEITQLFMDQDLSSPSPKPQQQRRQKKRKQKKKRRNRTSQGASSLGNPSPSEGADDDESENDDDSDAEGEEQDEGNQSTPTPVSWDEGLEALIDIPDGEMPSMDEFKRSIERCVCIAGDVHVSKRSSRCREQYTFFANEADQFMRRINLALGRPPDSRLTAEDVGNFRIAPLQAPDWGDLIKRMSLVKSLVHAAYQCIQACIGNMTAVTDIQHARMMARLALKVTGRLPNEYCARGGKVVDFSYALGPGHYLYVPARGTPDPDGGRKTRNIPEWADVVMDPASHLNKEIELSFQVKKRKWSKEEYERFIFMDNGPFEKDEMKPMLEALRKRYRFAQTHVLGQNPVALLSTNTYSMAAIAYQVYFTEDITPGGCRDPEPFRTYFKMEDI